MNVLVPFILKVNVLISRNKGKAFNVTLSDSSTSDSNSSVNEKPYLAFTATLDYFDEIKTIKS